jgi:hypothetical protein
MTSEFSKEQLKRKGFRGFLSLQELAASDLSKIPEERGLYLIFRDSTGHPKFLEESPVKNLRPNTTVALSMLEQRWVPGASLLFIGVAGKPRVLSGSIRDRVAKLIGFMSGKQSSHFAARVLWQLSEASSLLLAWKETGVMAPTYARSMLLVDFRKEFGKVPFGNTDADVKR